MGSEWFILSSSSQREHNLSDSLSPIPLVIAVEAVECDASLTAVEVHLEATGPHWTLVLRFLMGLIPQWDKHC